MTTIVAINGYLAADRNHASYQDLPRYSSPKIVTSNQNAICLAKGGISSTPAELKIIATILETYLFNYKIKDKKLQKHCYGLYKKLYEYVNEGECLIAMQKLNGEISTIVVENESVDLPWREDGIVYGTGDMIAKGMYHAQKLKGEFDIHEIMQTCAMHDCQTSKEYDVVNANSLFELSELTDEDILENLKFIGEDYVQ